MPEEKINIGIGAVNWMSLEESQNEARLIQKVSLLKWKAPEFEIIAMKLGGQQSY